MSLIVTFFFALVSCWLVCFPVVWGLKVFKVGQNIRKEGPSTHFIKAGTPTMGGIPVILTILIFMIILINIDIDLRYFGLVLLFLSYAFIGFLDDFLKIKKRGNLGLSTYQKLFWQILFAGIFAALLIYKGHNTGVHGILKTLHFDMPWLYFPFICFVVVGGANAVNLTDGLDGLATATMAIAFAALAIVCYYLQLMDQGLIAASAAGAMLAFLWFNIYPAEVFMGDVGSMGLGALISGIAVLIHEELVFALIGGVFVMEALSVLIQVISFKMFKRRVFRMTPLHHHFEMLGMSEPVVVLMFSVIALLFAVIGIWASMV